MVLRDPPFLPPRGVKGSVWAKLGPLQRPADAPAIPKSYIVDIIPAGQQRLVAGASYDSGEIKGPWRVMSLIVDFASGITADVYLDGVLRFRSTDGGGMEGQFTLGNGTTYMDLEKIRVAATNPTSGVGDVRAWMVVL